jgi:dGTPase
VDDALSVGLILPQDLEEVEFWRRVVVQVSQRHKRLAPEQFQPTVIRAFIDWQVRDLLETTRNNLRRERIRCIADVRAFPGTLVAFGPEMVTLRAGLEAFLHRRVYHHYRVQRMAVKGARVIQALCTEFCRAPLLLPDRYSRRIPVQGLERTVCDYVAGMTDRYAQDDYLRLFQPYAGV